MPFATPEIQAFAYGFPMAMLVFLIGLLILALTISAYVLLSPLHELKLAREGNAAAAVSLGGAGIALALPIAAAVKASATPLEAALWGVSVAVLQLLFNRLADMGLRGLPERIAAGEASAAWLMIAVRTSIGLVLAAAVAG